MFHRGFLLACLSIVTFGGGTVWAEGPKPALLFAVHQPKIRRSMNLIKKAPRSEESQRALQDLQELGIPYEDIRRALVLDHLLLDPDQGVRIRTCWRLIDSGPGPSIVAAGNLRNLIATEIDPDLVWMHALALSSIDPQSGTALELLARFPHDPKLRKTIWDDEERLTKYVGGLRRLSGLAGKPGKAARKMPNGIRDGFAFGRPAKPTREEILLKAYGIDPVDLGIELGIARSDVVVKLNPVEHKPPIAPPPPQKIPAHPLIAKRDFDAILALAEQGSAEGNELLRIYAEDFPHEKMARKYVPLAFGRFPQRERERAIEILSLAGPDARQIAAVALVDMVADSREDEERAIRRQAELVKQIKEPGVYTQAALKNWRWARTPELRMAVITAMSRVPEMKNVMTESLRDALISRNPRMKQAAREIVKELDFPNPAPLSWLKEELLTSNDLDRLARVAEELEPLPRSADFRRKIFKRIASEKDPTRNLILIGYLQTKTDPGTETAKKLSQLTKAMRLLEEEETYRQLGTELQSLIELAKALKIQTEQEAFEELKNLALD